MFIHAALEPKHFQNMTEGRSSGLIPGGNGILFRGKNNDIFFLQFDVVCPTHNSSRKGFISG